MALNREQLMAARDRIKTKVIPLHVPAWADDTGDDLIYVRPLSARERDLYLASIKLRRPNRKGGVDEAINEDNSTAKLIVRLIVNEDGNRTLEDKDATWVGELDAESIDIILKAVAGEGGLTDESAEEIEGESEAEESAASTSA